jgi:ornithine cyclodeaminase/alanine dehydrogenase-like protein (mu-crystallin family)
VAPKIQGSLTLLDRTGAPTGFLNASELTAFRTALGATMILRRRAHVSHILVFGAGKQAYWHIRLALLLRGPDIKHIHIINRSFATAEPLLQSFYCPSESSSTTPPYLLHNTQLSILTPSHSEYSRLLKEAVRKSDIIFCCTPATSPLFPAQHLTSTEGRKKGRYISAIGSYKPHMCELAPEILRQAVAAPHHHHHHKHASTAGVVIVDSLTGCLKEAGEIIQAELTAEQLVEIGELVMLRRQVQEQEGKTDQGGKDDGLIEWLRNGNVIYKSVGLGLMDLTVGGELLKMAGERGIGTRVEAF